MHIGLSLSINVTVILCGTKLRISTVEFSLFVGDQCVLIWSLFPTNFMSPQTFYSSESLYLCNKINKLPLKLSVDLLELIKI